MRNVLILENSQTPMEIIRESMDGTKLKNKYMMGGLFTEFGVKNRNERIYTWEKFKPALNEMVSRIQNMVVYGELDHPDVFDTSLKNASHRVMSAEYITEKNAVYGTIKLLPTKWGKQAREMIDEDNPLYVSSRAAGVTETNNEVAIKKLFTYDLVADPGFPNALMNTINESVGNTINESVGFSNNTDFRIIEVTDESKINQLFNMNANDKMTENQLAEYSGYVAERVNLVERKINDYIKNGNIDAKKLEELIEYYESMRVEQEVLSKYLNYLSEKVQVLFTENKELKGITEGLIKHNDYLAEHLEASINYQGYMAEKMEMVIRFNEYIAEHVSNLIDYTEYIAENLQGSIDFAEYIAENLNHSIDFSEHIAENLEVAIGFTEYIAENLDDSMAHQEYMAEQLNNTVVYAGMITEKLNKRNPLILENATPEEIEAAKFPTPEEVGFVEYSEEEEEEDENFNTMSDVMGDTMDAAEAGEELTAVMDTETEEASDDENCRVVCDTDETGVEGELTSDVDTMDTQVDTAIMGDEGDMTVGAIEETPEMVNSDASMEEEEEEEVIVSESTAPAVDEECLDCPADEVKTDTMDMDYDNMDIDALIRNVETEIQESIKKAKVINTDFHFFHFMNKEHKDSFKKLEAIDQEKVASYINEKGNYYSSNDVLRLMKEALSIEAETFEQRLVKSIPSDLKNDWSNLNENVKVSLLSQGRLYPEESLVNESQIENFWRTRRFPSRINENSRMLISEEESIINGDSLTDEVKSAMLERMGFKKK